VTVARVPEREEHGFGKRDVSDVASACMIAGDEGLALALVADLIACPVAELDAGRTIVEVLQ
jgi:hypothetical protein